MAASHRHLDSTRIPIWRLTEALRTVLGERRRVWRKLYAQKGQRM